MTWFKVDDNSDFNEKIVSAGNEVWGAVCRAGAWSARNKTDGFVPDHIAELIAKPSVWMRAEAVRGSKSELGLVERRPLGWQIHDYLQWNPSAAEVDAYRAELAEKRRKAGLLGNAKRWDGNRKPIASASQVPSQVPSQTHRNCDSQNIPPVPVPVPVPVPDPDPDPDLSRDKPEPPRRVRRLENPDTEGWRAVKAEYERCYQERRGAPPPFGGRDGKAISDLLAKLGKDHDRACRIVRQAFADGWWSDKLSLSQIAADPARFESTGRSPPRQQTLIQGGGMCKPMLVIDRAAERARGDSNGL